MQGEKLSYQFEAICGIAAEPADGLRYYEIDSTGFAVINEPKQFLPLILFGAGDSFVIVKPGKFPIVTGVDVILIVRFLGFQTFKLGI